MLPNAVIMRNLSPPAFLISMTLN